MSSERTPHERWSPWKNITDAVIHPPRTLVYARGLFSDDDVARRRALLWQTAMCDEDVPHPSDDEPDPRDVGFPPISGLDKALEGKSEAERVEIYHRAAGGFDAALRSND